MRSKLLQLASVFSALIALAAWIAFRTWPRRLAIHARAYPSVNIVDGRLQFPFPSNAALGSIAIFDNELSAFLWFDYVRSRPALNATEVLLTATERRNEPIYKIFAVLPNDAPRAIADLEYMNANGLALNPGHNLVFSNSGEVEYFRDQTRLFLAAYKRPVTNRLEVLTNKNLIPSVARFLIFKSRTDPRTRNGTEVRSLNREQATELAADIIAVSKFYELPLEIFLGIGAMENNYLNVRGDLEHTVWKRRASKDDIIVRRRKHRVLVSDYSIGVWQITRETLRYAHRLYLEDNRDYSQLPERLRPPKVLQFDLTDSHVLTTYAGLLLRDLLDRFNGDVQKAVGAYNGGPRNPNLDYAAGVQTVAEYAKNMLEKVSAINGRRIAQTTFFFSRSRR